MNLNLQERVISLQGLLNISELVLIDSTEL